MARMTVTVYTDSLTGEEVKDTKQLTSLLISIGDDSYSLDLTPASLKKLEAALDPFTKTETKFSTKSYWSDHLKASTPQPTKSAPIWSDSEREECRAWLKANGYPVPEKGRIRKDWREAWKASKQR